MPTKIFKIGPCEIYIGNPKTTRNCFRYETFIYLFEFKVFRQEERETHTISSTNTRHISSTPAGLYEARPKIDYLPLDSNLNYLVFFKNSKILSAYRHDAFHVPGNISYLFFFYCDISDCHIRPARA